MLPGYKRQLKQRLWVLLGGAVLVFILYKLLDSRPAGWESFEVKADTQREGADFHDKWIVVTTVQQPTAAIRKWANMPGWKMVVVGDRRTPVTWELKRDNVIYLDVKAQGLLTYTIAAMLPFDSYTRKMLGYLYAIEHGAKYIYETDDDNHPLKFISDP